LCTSCVLRVRFEARFVFPRDHSRLHENLQSKSDRVEFVAVSSLDLPLPADAAGKYRLRQLLDKHAPVVSGFYQFLFAQEPQAQVNVALKRSGSIPINSPFGFVQSKPRV